MTRTHVGLCRALGVARAHPELYLDNKELSSTLEQGDRGHNRHGHNRGVLCPFRGALGTRLIQCGLHRGQLPYKVA